MYTRIFFNVESLNRQFSSACLVKHVPMSNIPIHYYDNIGRQAENTKNLTD